METTDNICRVPNPHYTFPKMFRDWDKVRETKDCPYCHGTGKAPGDGATECGFCS